MFFEISHEFFKDKGFVSAFFYNPYSPQYIASHTAAAEQRSAESNAIRGLGIWTDSLAKWMNLVFPCFILSAQFPEHVNSQILAQKQSKVGVSKLSLKSHTVNICLCFWHMVSASTSQLCHYSAQGSNRQYLKEWARLCSKNLSFTKEMAGQIWPGDCSLSTLSLKLGKY